MRLIVAVLFAVISFGASGETPTIRDYAQLAATPAKPKMHLAMSRTKKILVRVSNPDDLDDNDDGGGDEIDVYIGYRRPELIKPMDIDADPELSDYVKTRLLVARARALKKFAETYPDLV
jgi:hypothetical protein